MNFVRFFTGIGFYCIHNTEYRTFCGRMCLDRFYVLFGHLYIIYIGGNGNLLFVLHVEPYGARNHVAFARVQWLDIDDINKNITFFFYNFVGKV